MKQHILHSTFSILTVVSLLLLPGIASALDPNSSLPVQIESDSAVIDDQKGISNYSGSVVVTQGKTFLKADSITVTAKDRKITTIQATGKPAIFEQHSEDGKSTKGHADQINYTAEPAILSFENNARLEQQNNSFSGELIQYDLEKRAIKAKGNEEQGERVRIQYHTTGPTEGTNADVAQDNAKAPSAANSNPATETDPEEPGN